MGSGIKARITRIGNSRGVRIPKILLDQAKLGEEVELEAREGELIIRSRRAPRAGWGEDFARMAARGDDKLLDAEAISLSTWDKDEWEW